MKRITALISMLIIVAVLVCAVPVRGLAAEEIDIDAKGVIIVETNSGEILYEKNKDARLPEASVTKIMTVLVALDACENSSIRLTDVVTASDKCWDDLDYDSSNVDIQPGEQMTFDDLLHCALIASANESCNIIAEHVGGNVDNFVKMMNDKAKALGCKNTNYTNSHGLHDENHYTSAYDQYLVLNAAMAYPKFREIVGMYEYTVPATNQHEARELINTNVLINRNSEYYYEYCTGGKTGSTSDAGFCLAAQAEYEDMKVISVVLGAGDEETENGYLIKSFSETCRLYRWAFTNFMWLEICASYEMVTSIPVDLAADTDHVNVQPASALRVLTDVETTADDIERDIVVYAERDGVPLEAPVEKGEVLGEMTVSLHGEPRGSVKLIASTDIGLSKAAFISRSIKNTLSKWWVKLIIAVVALLAAGYTFLVVRYHIIRRRKKEAVRIRQRQIAAARQNPVFTAEDNISYRLDDDRLHKKDKIRR